jgi:hypothetical protein
MTVRFRYRGHIPSASVLIPIAASINQAISGELKDADVETEKQESQFRVGENHVIASLAAEECEVARLGF